MLNVPVRSFGSFWIIRRCDDDKKVKQMEGLTQSKSGAEDPFSLPGYSKELFCTSQVNQKTWVRPVTQKVISPALGRAAESILSNMGAIYWNSLFAFLKNMKFMNNF